MKIKSSFCLLLVGVLCLTACRGGEDRFVFRGEDKPLSKTVTTLSARAEEALLSDEYESKTAPKSRTITLLGRTFRLRYKDSFRSDAFVYAVDQYSFEGHDSGLVAFVANEERLHAVVLPDDVVLPLSKTLSEEGLVSAAKALIEEQKIPFSEDHVYSCRTLLTQETQGGARTEKSEKFLPGNAEKTQAWVFRFVKMLGDYTTEERINVLVNGYGNLRELYCFNAGAFDGVDVPREDLSVLKKQAETLLRENLSDGFTVDSLTDQEVKLGFFSDGALRYSVTLVAKVKSADGETFDYPTVLHFARAEEDAA